LKIRFLCVDDERKSLQTLSRICLEQNPDNEVYAFDSSAEALAFAAEHQIDVALLDIDMPAINGLRLTEKLTAIYPKINIILVTAFSEYALEGFTHNCSGYLLKPFTLAALNEQLKVLRYPLEQNEKELTVTCFGEFDVLYKGKSVLFSYSKTKELFAYLIDRRGCACSNRQIAAVLWEDDNDHSEYLKKLKKDLTETLDAIGCNNILSASRGFIGLNVSLLDCDYFDFLTEKNKKFVDEYMEQYSWAEFTKPLLRSLKS